MQGEHAIRWTETEEIEEIDAATLGPGVQPSDFELEDVIEKKEATEVTLPAPKRSIKQSDAELPKQISSKEESGWKVIEEKAWSDDDDGQDQKADIYDIEKASRGNLYDKAAKEEKSTEAQEPEITDLDQTSTPKLLDQGTRDKKGFESKDLTTEDVEDEPPLRANLYDKTSRQESKVESAAAEADFAEPEKGYRSLLVDQHPRDAYDADDDAGMQADISDLDDELQQGRIYDKYSRSISEQKSEAVPDAYDLGKESRAQLAEKSEKRDDDYDSSAKASFVDSDKDKFGRGDLDDVEEEKPDGKYNYSKITIGNLMVVMMIKISALIELILLYCAMTITIN